MLHPIDPAEQALAPGLPGDLSATLAFLHGQMRDNGLFADGPGAAEGDVRSTNSVLKSLAALGAPLGDSRVAAAIAAARGADGGFGAHAGAESSVLDTCGALIALATLGDDLRVRDFAGAGLAYNLARAQSQFDHFMTIALVEECGLADRLPDAVEFFEARLGPALEQRNAMDAGIAASALLRAHQRLEDPDAVADQLISMQNPDGGFGAGGPTTLFATYCVMRALVMIGKAPHTRQLVGYLDSLRTPLGWAAAPGGPTSAGAIYQVTGIAEWIADLQSVPVAAARSGDAESVRSWLAGGGMPDIAGTDGWTPLAAAAGAGHADCVQLLLAPDVEGATPASPRVRFAPADLLPVHLAAQSGDLQTTRLLLDAAPHQATCLSSVNGHTVLLQAAFFGTSGHQEIARYVLENAEQLTGAVGDEARLVLLEATNVRGYSALTMQDLWHNEPMRELLESLSPVSPDVLAARSQAYAQRLKYALDSPEEASSDLADAIDDYIAGTTDIEPVKVALRARVLDINRRTGSFDMTPLIRACTGVDVDDPDRGARRLAAVQLLLDAGADPTIVECHPMGVGAVIRASVLNNLDLLQAIAAVMDPRAFADEMNVSPPINGLTAMHDAVHRALTSPADELDRHLEQIRWMIAHGARIDIPNNSGLTQRALALEAVGDAAFDAGTVHAVLQAMGIDPTTIAEAADERQ